MFALYRLAKPLQVIVYTSTVTGANFVSHQILNSVEGGYCTFAFCNTGDNTVYLKVACKYAQANKNIEIGDLRFSYTEI